MGRNLRLSRIIRRQAGENGTVTCPPPAAASANLYSETLLSAVLNYSRELYTARRYTSNENPLNGRKQLLTERQKEVNISRKTERRI